MYVFTLIFMSYYEKRIQKGDFNKRKKKCNIFGIIVSLPINTQNDNTLLK